MKIIKTVYFPPTKSRSARVTATLTDYRRAATATLTLPYLKTLHHLKPETINSDQNGNDLSGAFALPCAPGIDVVFAAAVSALFAKHEIVCSAFEDRTMLPIPTARGYDFVIPDSRDTSINIDEMNGFIKALGWAL